MKALMLPLAALTLAYLPASAESSEQDRWQERQQALCAYDPYCGRLREADSWRMPSNAALDVVRAYARDIERASEIYGVDELAVAGAIVAEHTMNVSLTDHVQDLLAAANVEFARPSIGLAQIKRHQAHAVEAMAAAHEGRPRRTTREVRQALLRPRDAILYVAGMMRDAQDVYAVAGFEMASRPEILVTLFNIGYPRERLQRTLRERRTPRPNYFGVFVMMHEEQIRQALRAGRDVTRPTPSSR
jgi:hypothetical protein